MHADYTGIVCLVIIFAASVTGIAAKDWRACCVTLGVALFLLVMMLVGHR